MWLAAACSVAVAPDVGGAPTEQGLYRFVTETTEAGLVLRLTDSRGRPVEDAALWPQQPGVLVDPGECDSIEEARCFHPGGIYVLRLPAPRGSALEVVIEAGSGEDRAVIRSPAP